MPVTLISSFVNYKNKLAIGQGNNLLIKLKEDLKFFKSVTSGSVVVMGRKTWFSIPIKNRPFQNRINIVLTNDPELLKTKKSKSNKLIYNNVYFMTFEQFKKYYMQTQSSVFVIGGGEVFNMFLSSDALKPIKIYLTEIKGLKLQSDPDTFLTPPDKTYKLIGVSEKMYQDNINFRILTYKNVCTSSEEVKYLDLCKEIIQNGVERPDRTGVGTRSVFGRQIRFDISQSIPLLTTKRVSFKGILEELLFFCTGSTDAKMLSRKGVKIWDSNTSREFLDGRNLQHYDVGIMGPMYGWSWRNFGGQYSQAFADTTSIDMTMLSGFDQLAHVEHLLKTDPFSRRIYITCLNPEVSNQMVLEPCHILLTLYVSEKNNQRYLSGHFVMRSNDIGCGFPYNIVSYTVLVYILALRCDMKPLEIVYSCSDCHVYNNHIEGLDKQLTREPRPFPRLLIDKSVKNKDWSEMEGKDFELIGYIPDDSIPLKMAI